MELDFLHLFEKRMKHVGSYALLFKNSMQKQKWKAFDIESVDAQTNMIFSVLLYIMEQSLKDEPCTMDDICEFLDQIDRLYHKRNLSYQQNLELGDFIVNVILCDEGRAMYFEGFDYDKGMTEVIHISFVANRIVYVDGQSKRTSYYLTEEGYNLVLGTLEIESSMQLTIHEMIFKLQLEKASYDKAADEIKNVFNRLRIQLQGMEEAMRQIRQNALGYSVEQYENVMKENMNIIDTTKEKFGEYRNYVNRLVKELEEHESYSEQLEKDEQQNLKYLRIIGGYLDRALDEYQQIFSTHFDLKSLYDKELESLLQMSLIRRFSIQNDLYQEVLKDASTLSQLDIFFRPLFRNDVDKIYQLSKTVEDQRVNVIEEEEEIVEELFDEEAFLQEKERQRVAKMQQYDDSLMTLLMVGRENVSTSGVLLSQIQQVVSLELKEKIAPNIEIFREVMVELLRVRNVDLILLKKEQESHFFEESKDFNLKQSILRVVEKEPLLQDIKAIHIKRIEDGKMIRWSNILDQNLIAKDVYCSNVDIQFELY